MKIFNSALPVATTRNLGEIYLVQARVQKELENFTVALPLYDQAKETLMSLMNVKEALRQAQDPKSLTDEALRGMLADAYFERGETLARLNLIDKARASYLKAEKFGHPKVKHKEALLVSNHSSLSSSVGRGHFKSLSMTFSASSNLSALSVHAKASDNSGAANLPSLQFFPKDPPASVVKDPISAVGERLLSTQHLAYCLNSLLPNPQETSGPKFSKEAEEQAEERERLYRLADDTIASFLEDKLKSASTVAEIVALAPVLKENSFRRLLGHFIDGIRNATLLEFNLLDGLPEIIRGAAPNYLREDDLVKILDILNQRLQDTFRDSTANIYHLTCAVSRVLDAMADSKIAGLNRETLHAPLLNYLKSLQGHSNPYLVYQAAYACEALKHVPDDETRWQGGMRRAQALIKGASGLISAAKGFDLNKFLDSFMDIQAGFEGLGGLFETVSDAYDQVTSLVDSGQSFGDCLKEALDFNLKGAWYEVLRGIDELLQQQCLTGLEKLVMRQKAFCRQHQAFQWGLSERLGQLAANPHLEDEIRQGALRFLGDLYTNDAQWGQQVNLKQRIIQIIKELEGTASPLAEAAKQLLGELSQVGDVKKQALFQACQENPASPYPLFTEPPLPASPSLLDRAQHKPEVEASLRKLQKRRNAGWQTDEALYISPRGKKDLHAAETFKLEPAVRTFLQSKQQVLLQLGDSGAGKSTFNRALEAQLWKEYKKGARIPLLITLPDIDNPVHQLVEQHLRNELFSELQIQELRANHSFVFILDGYDESQQTQNLYQSNRFNQKGQWRGKVIIGCRTEYFGVDDRGRFEPDDPKQLQEIVIAPFSSEEIDAYLAAYVKVNPLGWSVARYQEALQTISNLKELVRNPFLLRITLEVLPNLVNQGQVLSTRGLTRTALYDQFVEHWFERAKQRFLTEKTLGSHEKQAFEELIDEGFTRNGIAFVKALAIQLYERQGGSPIVRYVRFEDKGTWKEEFFGSGAEQRVLRGAWPLNRNGDQYQFIHKSLLEYFVARAVFEPKSTVGNVETGAAPQQTLSRRGSVNSMLSVDTEIDVSEAVSDITPLSDSLLARKNLVKEPAILQFLAERAQKEPALRKQLHALIDHSKIDSDAWKKAIALNQKMATLAIKKAAANAITILVKAGVPFTKADLKGIQVPGADLSFGVFDSAQLQGADLRKANLRAIWLRAANLSGAQMAGIRFGELPFLQEDSRVNSCAYSPDGKRCIVGLNSGKINVYSTSDWEKVYTLEGHAEIVSGVAYAPSGEQIVSGSWDKTVRLWDAQSGALKRTLEGHAAAVSSVVYSPSGRQIASGSEDKTVRLWDTQSGALTHVLEGHTGGVLSVVYAPSGAQIASGSRDKTVRLWDAQSGIPGNILEGHTAVVLRVAYAPNGEQIASCSDDFTVRLWDAQSGVHGHTLEGHSSSVLSVVYSPSGKQIASSSWDKTVRLWDAQSGRLRRALEGHAAAVWSIAYSPSGEQIVSGGEDNAVRLWDAQGRTPRHTLAGHIAAVWGVAYSPSGSQLASASRDNTVQLWDAQSGNHGYVLEGHTAPVLSVVYAPSGEQLASGSDDSTVRLWDAQSGAYRHVLNGHTSAVLSVTYLSSGEQIASGSWDQTVRLWDAQSGVLLHTLEGHTAAVWSVAYAPNGEQLASGSEDQTVRLWNVQSGTPGRTLEGHAAAVWSVAYSPNGKQIASGSLDTTVRLWDAQSGMPGHTLEGHAEVVYSVIYSPSGEQIASGSLDHTVRLWEAQSGQCQMMIQDCGPVKSLAWREVSGSHYVGVGSLDNSVRQWEVTKVEEGYQPVFCWSSTHSFLTVKGTLIKGVRGLDRTSMELLKQRGAVVEHL